MIGLEIVQCDTLELLCAAQRLSGQTKTMMLFPSQESRILVNIQLLSEDSTEDATLSVASDNICNQHLH